MTQHIAISYQSEADSDILPNKVTSGNEQLISDVKY